METPALYGGKPVFDELLPIITPTLFDPKEIITPMQEIFGSGMVTVSKYVKQFEEACKDYLGVKHAVGVSCCTSGLMLSVKLLGLSGEVIVPSFTFTATVHSLIWNNITPVFVDCEPGTYNIDPAKIEELITDKTSAIMPVYIFGNPPEINELEKIVHKYNLKLIFDSAQAFGAYYNGQKAGSFGDCEIFSLSPTKVLTSLEGGLITTNNAELARKLRQGRDYGKGIDDIDFIGLSTRMSELHGLVGLTNLKHTQKCINNRLQLISRYKEILGSLEGLSFQFIKDTNRSSGNYMVIFVNEDRFGLSRNELYTALAAENIQTKKYFYPAVHKQQAYSSFLKQYAGKLPVTEKAADEGLALPLYGHMDKQTAETVCHAIKRIHAWSRNHG